MALIIGDLIEGRDRPVSVLPSDRLSSAIEQMRRHDFTQLPVTADDEKLVGIVTSDSILSALEAFGLPAAKMSVADAMKKPKSFDPDADVGDLLNALRDDYAAVVVDSEGKLRGIITGFDASEYFRRQSEDIMLIEDIESSIKEHVLSAFADNAGKTNHGKLNEMIGKVADPNKSVRGRVATAVRQYVQQSTASSEVNEAVLDEIVKSSSPQKILTFDDLTLNAYIDLLLHASVWEAYSEVFGIERDALRRLLETVRDTRNVLAHFRGEISAIEREKLRFCASWLERHPPRSVAIPVTTVVVTPAVEHAQSGNGEIVPVDDQIEPGEGRYAKLAVWLQKTAPNQDSISLTFNQVEEILGGQLPASARGHRSWWANDRVSHPQSTRWREVGWRVANVNLADEIAVFSRIEERESAYMAFFNRLHNRLEGVTKFHLRSASPSGVNWHTFGRIPDSGGFGVLVCSFARGHRLRVEFYLDTKDKDFNKEAFDKLASMRGAIEEHFGGSLSWERLDGRRASRIATYKPGAITWPASELKELVPWAADSLTRLHDALADPVRDFLLAAGFPSAPSAAVDFAF